MGAWSPAMFADDLALDIRREYSILLSVGNTDEDTEKTLINHYSSLLNCNDPDEDVFWFALALCEWKKGRLSSFVKEKALCALETGHDLERWNTAGNEKDYQKRKLVLSELRETILSPMPPIKKVKKPTVHHCPWKVGSLLAYRIVSNKKYLSGHPCHTKYVLLRVVKIDKHPISAVFDTGYYDETMMIGLYNWIGSKIPNPDIVHRLKYIPVLEYAPRRPTGTVDWSLVDSLTKESGEKIKKAVGSFFERTIEKCVWLNWRSTKDEQGDITFLACDDDFQNNIPDFFKPELSARTFTHFGTFDISLANRFDPYLDNLGNVDSAMI